MSRIVIRPAWILSSEAGDHFEPQLFRLLRAIHESGKLTRAVEVVGLSYRHGWDLLGKWNAIFGSELVAMQRGRGAQLTALGEKLLWAEQRTADGVDCDAAIVCEEKDLVATDLPGTKNTQIFHQAGVRI